MILYANNILINHIILNELFLIVYPSFLLNCINWNFQKQNYIKIIKDKTDTMQIFEIIVE